MKDKKPRIRNRSRSRSYGKKGPHRRFTRRKQRAIESARVREPEAVEVVEPTAPTETPPEPPTQPKKIRRPRRVTSRREDGKAAVYGGWIGCSCLLTGILSLVLAVGGGILALSDPFTVMGIVLSISGVAAIVAACYLFFRDED